MGSCKWNEPKSGRRKGTMVGDSAGVDVAVDVGVWLEGLVVGGGGG